MFKKTLVMCSGASLGMLALALTLSAVHAGSGGGFATAPRTEFSPAMRVLNSYATRNGSCLFLDRHPEDRGRASA